MKLYKIENGEEVELSASEVKEYNERQAAGAAYEARQAIINQIHDLEGQQTPRRIREALAGIDDGWLENLNEEIDALREQLNSI